MKGVQTGAVVALGLTLIITVNAQTDREDPAVQALLERLARSADIYDIERITTWFEIEVNNLRFPSRVEIRRINYTMEPGKNGYKIRPDPVLQVDQTYQHYEFFGVSTREDLGSVAAEEP